MECNCNSTKCHLLGSLEQKIMDILWASKNPLKPQEVLSKLKEKYAYTTVMTVLKRMAEKKLVGRKLVGKVYFYSPKSTKAVFSCHCLEDLFTRLFKTYGKLTVDSFKKIAKTSGYKL
ncbi:MAG: BlaI/MecI/CopY family transcriptional regulator [Candidatus Shapirobacteria bacterium]